MLICHKAELPLLGTLCRVNPAVCLPLSSVYIAHMHVDSHM